MGWDEWTAIGTLALAVMTLAAVIVTIVITAQDRRRADVRVRHERLWSDAEVVAEVDLLLVALAPERRGMSAGSGPAENEVWASLYGNVGQVEARLRALAIGHASDAVRSLASELPRVLWRAAMSSREHVQSAAYGDPGETLTEAQVRHREALDELGLLEAAITSTGRADDRKRRRRWCRGA
jgi:hypothetical protein